MSVEYLSFTQEEDGRVTKKRLVQKTAVDPRSALDATRDANVLLNAAQDANVLSSPASTDFPEVMVDGSTEPMGDATSSAVSVSIFFFLSIPCHVTDGSHSAGETRGMDTIPSTVPQ